LCCLQTVRHRTTAWPCGVCAKDAPTDCVLCGTCGRWLHRACECLTHEQLRELHLLSLSYVCSSCLLTPEGDFNVQAGLIRMQQVTFVSIFVTDLFSYPSTGTLQASCIGTVEKKLCCLCM